MIRLFVAIDFPTKVRRRLADMAGGIPGARWTDEAQMHLTLRFIGEVEEPLLPDIAEALRLVRLPAFELGLEGIGSFGKLRQARVLWAGVKPSDRLAQLQGKIETVLHDLIEPESRKFHPHVTIARLKKPPPDRLGTFLAAHDAFASEPFEVGEFHLYSSFLGQGGAIHTIEATFPLERSGK